MAEQTRIVRWPGNPDEAPAAAVPFALDDAGPALIPPRSAAVAAAAIAALFLFADQGHMPTPAAASPSAGTAMSRDRVRIVNWSQNDELPVAAAAFALDDFGEPIRPQQVDRTTSVLWVGGGEDVGTTPPAMVEFEQDWEPKAGPWPAPVVHIQTDPAEAPPEAVAPLPFDEDAGTPLQAFILPPALLAAFGGAVDEIATAASGGGGGDCPTTAQIVAALMAEEIETGVSVRMALRIILAAVSGRTTGVGTSTERYLSVNGALARITATFDGDSNRTSVTLDGS